MVCDSLERRVSGAAGQAFSLARALGAQGIPVQFVAGRYGARPKPGKPEAQQAGSLPIPIHELPNGAGRIANWRFVLRLAQWIRRHADEFDILHVHGGYAHSFAAGFERWRLGKRSLVKLTLSGSDLSWHGAGHGRVLKRKLFLLNDRFVAISRSLERDLARLGIAPERIRFIPNGVDTARFRPAADAAEKRALRQRLGIAPESKCVAFMGLVSRRKGADLLAEAWIRVAKRIPGAALLMIGPERHPYLPVENCREDIARLLRENGLEQSVRFTGAVENSEEWLRAADAFALPSRAEGMPNALLEAMATGLPCAVSRIAGVLEIVRDSQETLLFSPDSADAADELAGHLATLLGNEALARETGACSRAAILERFSIERIASEYAALYKEMQECGASEQ